jgi:endonuclease III
MPRTKRRTKPKIPNAGALSDYRVRKLYDILAETIDPESDLDYDGAFELLVAVVLSAQATDKSVNEATAKLYPIANTPAEIHALGESGLKPFIQHIGLFNTKAKNVIKLCKKLIDEHDSKVPEDRASLEALPGVGRKTANVVLNIAFMHPTIAVDTHVHRVANRTGIAVTKNPDQTERVLLARTPRKHMLHAHHYLILHGRYCCKARKPECARCPISRQCLYEDKTE